MKMTELELYEFIKDGELKIDWRGEELILWVDFWSLKYFTKIIRMNLDDGGYDVNLQENCIVLNIVPICEYWRIEPENILPK